MADIAPFAAWRYDPAKAGALENVITQPYDKISPEMLKRYLSLSPCNLAHVIKTTDYANAASRLWGWRETGALAQDPGPALYPYFQTYTVPGTTEKRTRKALVAALRLEDYDNKVVFRHERTMSGPKADRLELLRATRTHCELLFLLHDDPAGEIAGLVERATASAPVAAMRDDFGDDHAVWRADEPGLVAAFQKAFSPLKLLIADGHHRYETALSYRAENPAADRVLAALVSMDAPGLTILPTHRLLSGVAGFERERFLAAAGQEFEIIQIPPELGRLGLAHHILGASFAGDPSFYLLKYRGQDDLDVDILHKHLLTGLEDHLEYVRGFDQGLEGVANGAQACFFLHAVENAKVREIAFAGGVMPQKSTDYYPKMLSGFVFYSFAAQ